MARKQHNIKNGKDKIKEKKGTTFTKRKSIDKTVQNQVESTESPSQLGDDEYEVERLVDKRIHRGQVQYLVKWVGYPDEENTWQPIDTMNCLELIRDFEQSQLLRLTPPKGETKSSSSPTRSRQHGYYDDWEDQVSCIESAFRDKNGQLWLELLWKSGQRTEETAQVANRRCPQKVIAFYESRLKFGK